MAENRLEREQKRLATEMNVAYVYVKSLRNGDIPYEARLTTFVSQNITTKQSYIKLSTFDSRNIKTKQPNPKHSKSTKQNSKGVRPKDPPTQSSLTHTYEQVTVDLAPPLPIDEVEHFIPQQTFRLRSPPTPLEELMNYTPNQRDMDRLIQQNPSNETQPNTNWTPQPPTVARNEQPHPKLYLAKREGSNFNSDFGYE